MTQVASFLLLFQPSEVASEPVPIKQSVSNEITKGIDMCHMAVEISSGYKAYGKYEVLKNLNLNVPTGAIYGLLGPSGCGMYILYKPSRKKLMKEDFFYKVSSKKFDWKL